MSVASYSRMESHRANDGVTPRCGLRSSFLQDEAVAKGLPEIGDSSSHAGNILIGEGAGLYLAGWCIKDEVLAEGQEFVEKF